MTKEKKDTKCDDLIDALLEKHGISPEAVLGENGLIAELKKRVVERALAGELTHHLGYAKGEAPEEVDNHRNGYSKKTVVGEEGAMEIEVPRDRSGSFDPLLIAKGQKRFEGFDEKIIAMYARGMTVREIQGFLLDHYRVEVSADFISTVTDSVLEAVVEWQNRPLERSYPVVYFDALGEDLRRGKRKEQSGVSGTGHRDGGKQRCAGHLDRAERGSQVLVESHERVAQPRSGGHSDRGGRRAEGFSGGHHHGFSFGQRADLHRAFKPLLPVFLRLEGAPGGGARTQGHLPGRNRRDRCQATQRV